MNTMNWSLRSLLAKLVPSFTKRSIIISILWHVTFFLVLRYTFPNVSITEMSAENILNHPQLQPKSKVLSGHIDCLLQDSCKNMRVSGNYFTDYTKLKPTKQNLLLVSNHMSKIRSNVVNVVSILAVVVGTIIFSYLSYRLAKLAEKSLYWTTVISTLTKY